ncbi:MAG: phosphoenolpyruvate carboxykinase [Chloroflexota bacterium]|nr:phosphoenolpyruvate carboxykinase [Chloroflexota bacterium]
MTSKPFREFLCATVAHLSQKDSPLLNIFPSSKQIEDTEIDILVQTLFYLTKVKGEVIPDIVKGSDVVLRDIDLCNAFVEYLYNYWRSFDRFAICSSTVYEMEEKPETIFNDIVEHFSHLVRKTYRDIQENITGIPPSIYRQVRAGAEIAAITSAQYPLCVDGVYEKLRGILMIRQVLLYPPLILNPPMNKRTGRFVRIDINPLEVVSLKIHEWLCYPAKVGELTILIYFHRNFFELGFSLCNLFQLAESEDLTKPPDGIYLFGVPATSLDQLAEFPTVFYDDHENHLLVAAIPNRDEFGYFGYLKKMVLTLHNTIIMQRGELPFHGAFVKIKLHNMKEASILLIGDTGAGKSETLEAFRILGDEHIKEMTVIADDMGSIKLSRSDKPKGYGTEIGAFVRLDDLQPGYAFGQIDRTIIMSPNQVNARAVLPVTTYANVVKGYPIDMVLYANNYEEIDEDHPIIEQFTKPKDALRVFREGTVMSKGTTMSTGLIHSYFANIFGPPQYKELHERISERYFKAFFANNVFVGQIRTRLGIPGCESSGPELAAKELLTMIQDL